MANIDEIILENAKIQEEFVSWKQHPYTEKVFKLLKEERDKCLDSAEVSNARHNDADAKYALAEALCIKVLIKLLDKPKLKKVDIEGEK